MWRTGDALHGIPPRMILPSRSLICVTLSSNTYHNKTSKGQSDREFLCSKISYSRKAEHFNVLASNYMSISPDLSEPGLSIS